MSATPVRAEPDYGVIGNLHNVWALVSSEGTIDQSSSSRCNAPVRAAASR